MRALKAESIYTPDQVVREGVVLVDGGKVAAVGRHVDVPTSAEVVDFGDRIIAPGLIDTHLHGTLGHDVMEGDAGESALALAEVLPRFGVTGFLPTPLTAPVGELVERTASISQAMKRQERGARILGIHMEGAFFNPARAGAQPPGYLVGPRREDCEALLGAGAGQLRIVSIAPELPGALEAIRFLAARGVVCSAAHTDATLEEFEAAVEAGMRQATHLYSAMRPFLHRDPGVIGGVWRDERVIATVIADLLHAHPVALEVARRMKGPRNLVVITDAVAAAGMPDGGYTLGGQAVRLERGAMILSGDRDDLAHAVLAGSVLTMDAAVRNLALTLGWPLSEVLRYATANAARSIGLEGRKGVVAPQADADLAILNPDLSVHGTMVGGEFAYRAG